MCRQNPVLTFRFCRRLIELALRGDMDDSSLFLRLLVILPLLFLAGCGGYGSSTPAPTPTPTPPAQPPNLALSAVVDGLTQPVDLQHPDDGSDRLFVVQQNGIIKIISAGALVATAFLDISGRVVDSGEKGLLGVAFHPSYTTTPKIYVNYVRGPASGGFDSQTVIAEYSAAGGSSNQIDPATEVILLTVDQPSANHKAGQLAFGPDGFLYFSLGDGGDSANSQNNSSLLGKMLRIDVDHQDTGLNYAIPSDNPFASGVNGLPEIYALGFRNPFRFSFDGTSLFVGDVGESTYEEVDLVTKGGNFGWPTMEGKHCFVPATGCDTSGLTLPIFEYDHLAGDATVIGGYIYRGSLIPSLVGQYIFGDFSSGRLWSLAQSGGTWTRNDLLETGLGISSLGKDKDGEVYVIDYSGKALHLIDQH